MKYPLLLCFSISLSVILASQSGPESPGRPVSARWGEAPPTSAMAVENYGKLPLVFETNQGQTNPQVKFLSRGAGYTLFLTSTEAVLVLSEGSSPEPTARAAIAPTSDDKKSAVLRMKLVGSDAMVEGIGQDELPGKSNYFIGNDPQKWHTNVRQYAKVRYKTVYPGVDLIYYGNQRELEYDFVLQPGADPTQIRLGIEGAKRLRFEHGDLVLSSFGGDVLLRRPHIYQQKNGTRQEIRGGYIIKSKNEVGFRVASYNRERPLIIDPVLSYSTYLGGSSSVSGGSGIAVDAEGNAYVTGTTSSTDFPTLDAIQPVLHGPSDAFVTKINADGSALVYSTYLGGSLGERSISIAVDAAGEAYVSGATNSTDFPAVNAIQPTYGGGSNDVFVTKVNAAGSALVYSTYLGGKSDDYYGVIAVDAVGTAYLTGGTSSTDFPTVNAIQPANGGGYSTFVAKINPIGSALVYSTYLGGYGVGFGIAVDAAGNAYCTGTTSDPNFPTVNAVQPVLHGPYDAFVTKLNAAGSAFVYSTYLGGVSGVEAGTGIAVDAAGNAYVSGVTTSTDFPTANAIQPTFGGGAEDAFVTKLNAAGNTLVYSTYLGGSANDVISGIAVDAAGNASVAGETKSKNFPTANAIQPKYHGGDFSGLGDAFAAKIKADGSVLVYRLTWAESTGMGHQASRWMRQAAPT
jgi:hypothetical protein